MNERGSDAVAITRKQDTSCGEGRARPWRPAEKHPPTSPSSAPAPRCLPHRETPANGSAERGRRPRVVSMPSAEDAPDSPSPDRAPRLQGHRAGNAADGHEPPVDRPGRRGPRGRRQQPGDAIHRQPNSSPGGGPSGGTDRISWKMSRRAAARSGWRLARFVPQALAQALEASPSWRAPRGRSRRQSQESPDTSRRACGCIDEPSVVLGGAATRHGPRPWDLQRSPVRPSSPRFVVQSAGLGSARRRRAIALARAVARHRS